MKADLHCHTTMSDGSLGLEETIAQAKRYGIDYFAITDHDTLSSSSRAVVLGERYGVNVIPAVEFSTYDSKHGTKAHIICYNPEKPNRLEGLCLRTCELRKKRGKQMAMKVIEKYPITLESILRYATGSKVIFKCHIMHALMDYGYTTDLYGKVMTSCSILQRDFAQRKSARICRIIPRYISYWSLYILQAVWLYLLTLRYLIISNCSRSLPQQER